MGLLVHVLGILTGFLGPLVLWLARRDSRFVDQHGRAALDFHITMAILAVAAVVLFFLAAIATLGLAALLLLPLLLLLAVGLGIATIVFGIMGALAANRGEAYRYPLAIRMLGRSA